MLFTTPTQYVALAIALIAGWLFGLASHPGGRRWKERYAAERESNAGARRELEAQVAERDARIRELERENARLAKASPVTAATISPTAQAAERPHGTAARGWFAWRNRAAVDRRI